jgi:Tfp pilus assembly protein PilF
MHTDTALASQKQLAVLLYEAETSLAQLDLERAAGLYQHARALDPDSPLPSIGLARVALATGRAQEGVVLLDAVLARHPESVEALTIRGAVAEHCGALEAAASLYTRAIRIAPANGQVRYKLGLLLAKQGRWLDASAQLRDAVSLLPYVPEVAVSYAMAAFKTGAWGDAVTVLRKSIERSPYSVGGYVALSEILIEAGKLDLADALLSSGESRFTRHALFPSKRAEIALRRGDVATALVHARKQAQLSPDRDEGWLLIAWLELSVRNVGAAEAASHEVLRRDSRNWRAYEQLGRLYATLGVRDLAEHAYRNAVALAPDEWQLKNQLAALLLEADDLGAISEARRLLEQAVEKAPLSERGMPQLNLAIACLTLGERATSERHARNAMRSAPPSHPVSQSAKRFLNNFASSTL